MKSKTTALPALIPLALGLAFSLPLASHAEDKVLNYYNWSMYNAEGLFPRFLKEHGVRVNFDPIDSEETLQSKMLSGKTGYDVVVPSSGFITNQIQAGLYQKLDKSRITSYGNLDKLLMQKLEVVDPGNQYAIPFAWGSDGLGINVTKVRQILGKDAPLDSWELLLNPKYVSKLKQCGVGVVDSAPDVISAALLYLKKDINNFTDKDLAQAVELLKPIRPYITQINSVSYVNDLAQGDLCLAMGWSGDVARARQIAKAAKKPFEIAYSIPKEGSYIWFDLMVIPKDAPHLDSAYQWLNFLGKPEVNAMVVNDSYYPSANKPGFELVKPEIRNDPAVYPSPEVMKRLAVAKSLPPQLARGMTRAWTNFKSNH